MDHTDIALHKALMMATTAAGMAAGCYAIWLTFAGDTPWAVALGAVALADFAGVYWAIGRIKNNLRAKYRV